VRPRGASHACPVFFLDLSVRHGISTRLRSTRLGQNQCATYRLVISTIWHTCMPTSVVAKGISCDVSSYPPPGPLQGAHVELRQRLRVEKVVHELVLGKARPPCRRTRRCPAARPRGTGTTRTRTRRQGPALLMFSAQLSSRFYHN